MQRAFTLLRTVALNGVMLLTSLLLAALMLEGGVRFFGLQPMHRVPDLHQAVEGGRVFELIPSLSTRGYNRETVITDEHGFRSMPIDPTKESIVFIGDSMTFGLGVENNQTNPAYFSTYFPDYNVINTGVSSYNIEQEVLTYEQKAKQLKPALVVLEFVTNDADPKAEPTEDGGWATDHRTKQEQEDALRTAITQKGTWRIPGKVFLHEHSALFTFIERRTKGMWFRAESNVLGPEWTEEQMAYYTQWFSRLTDSIGDTPKLFVRWPDNWLHPKTMLALDRMAAEQGWHVLNLGDLFGTSYEHLGWDQHPSAKTHAEAAEAMALYVQREGLLSSNK